MTAPSVALITGAASGLGRQLALELAANGTAIAAVDRREEGLRSLEEMVRGMGQSCAWALADVTRDELLQEAVAGLEARLGPIDLAIANAGIGRETSGLFLHAGDLADVIGVNLIGVTNTLAAVVPGMLRRRRGHVVGISSLSSLRGLPRMLGYAASKAAVNSLFEGLRTEVEPHGVHATVVCPGWIRTPMTANVPVAMPHLLEVEEAARTIVWAIRKKKRFYAFPRRLVWRMRVLTWLPRAWQDRLLRKMLSNAKRNRK